MKPKPTPLTVINVAKAPAEQLPAIAVPEMRELVTKAHAILEQAQALRVRTPADYTAAASQLVGIKALRKSIEETFKPLKRQAQDLVNNIGARWKEHDAPLDQAEQILKGKRLGWEDEEEKKRREREVKLQEEARKKAEEEQRKEAERLRAEAEERRKRDLAEAARMKKEGDAKAAAEARKRAEETAKAAIAAANEIESTPVQVETVDLPSRVPTIGGITRREYWSAAIDDPVALVQAAAADPKRYAELIQKMAEGAQPWLNAQARLLKQSLAIPGVSARSKDGEAVTA